MNFTLSGLLAGIVFGAAGLYVFREGKKRQNIYLYFIGISLMVFQWFTKTALGDWGVGLALCGVAYYMWDMY